MDRIFKAVSEEVAASPRIMQELFKLNYERKRARYTEGYCSPFLDRYSGKRRERAVAESFSRKSDFCSVADFVEY